MLWSFDKPSRGMSKQESNLEADTEFASDENFADYILEGVCHRAVSLQSQIPRVYWTQCQINPFWVQNRSKNSRKPFLTKDANSKAPNTYQKKYLSFHVSQSPAPLSGFRATLPLFSDFSSFTRIHKTAGPDELPSPASTCLRLGITCTAYRYCFLRATP